MAFRARHAVLAPTPTRHAACLSFATVGVDKIREGVARLAQAL